MNCIENLYISHALRNVLKNHPHKTFAHPNLLNLKHYFVLGKLNSPLPNSIYVNIEIRFPNSSYCLHWSQIRILNGFSLSVRGLSSELHKFLWDSMIFIDWHTLHFIFGVTKQETIQNTTINTDHTLTLSCVDWLRRLVLLFVGSAFVWWLFRFEILSFILQLIHHLNKKNWSPHDQQLLKRTR